MTFFSGVPYCPDYDTPHAACPRVLLAHLSHVAGSRSRSSRTGGPSGAGATTTTTQGAPAPGGPLTPLPPGPPHPHPAVSAAAGCLDVRLVRPYRHKPLGAARPFDVNVTLPAHPPTPMPDHARYRWLLNVDGLAGSSRMGLFMTTDSVLLKSRSPPFIEYYSRLQTPGSHYLELWSNASDPYDVLGVVAAARATAAADPAAVAAAVAANQAIAARYLSMQAKMLYARYALLAYHSLVPDMAQGVAKRDWHCSGTGIAAGLALQRDWHWRRVMRAPAAVFGVHTAGPRRLSANMKP
ncbi:hypothetical protein HXX76_007674 [Chlamydomonas incerta]|uniref:Glycosyl transferase CAP10 domain-containing protein n=1 Tax=Chlamydomonas incerta TaxID=51695 RepID=A0A835W2M1_CHLIN|nr:hypothetical protein HXX76_007674 [Chlamydomonas incerta]|eukprot:KAG2434789.1 hypothetical protein HXX76_007674 [Chlamydomonas incerta]